jgi:predicted amidophosphoribosyltransferase
MQDDLVKLCPSCGSEYQLWVERCLDCGVSLVHGREGQGEAIGSQGKEEESHDMTTYPQNCVPLRNAAVDWIRRLSEDLDEAGIRHWVSAPEWRRDPSLYVLPEDQEAAAVVDRARFAIEVPEVAAGDARPQRPVRRREPSSYENEVKVCPSCGGEFQLWAETCADCGVPLVRPWDLDSARESEPRVASPALAPADDPSACPACGERLAEGALECPGCGLMMAQPDACPRCGVELMVHSASCRRCGYELFGGIED